MEAIAAMDLALTLTMEDSGVEVDAAPLARVVIKPVLSGLGWTDVAMAEDDAEIHITAEVHNAVPLSAIAFAAQPFTDSATKLRLALRRTDTDTASEIEVELDAYAAWAGAGDGVEKEAAFVQLGYRTLVDRNRLFDDARAEKYLAFRGCQILLDQEVPHDEVARQVKVWRQVARDLGLTRLNRLLGKGLRLRTQSEAHISTDASEFDELIATAGRTLSGLPDALI